jgi:hypothetical protein
MAAEHAVEEATRVERVTVGLGEPATLDDLTLVVDRVRVVDAIVYKGVVYRPDRGYRLVAVHLVVRNVGEGVRSASEIAGITLVTDAGRSYSRVYVFELNPVFTGKGVANALEIHPLDLAADIPPGSSIDGYVLFEVPEGESPEKLVVRVGYIGGGVATILLTR